MGLKSSKAGLADGGGGHIRVLRGCPNQGSRGSPAPAPTPGLTRPSGLAVAG